MTDDQWGKLGIGVLLLMSVLVLLVLFWLVRPAGATLHDQTNTAFCRGGGSGVRLGTA